MSYSDAAKNDYSETLVINMGRTENNELIRSLAQVLGASVVGELPISEPASDAEVIVVIGGDQVPQEEPSEEQIEEEQ